VRTSWVKSRIAATESDSVASVIQKIIVKEQLEYAIPEMYRLVRCGNQKVTRDGSEPVRATLPRSGVVDVLTRTVRDYALVDGDILAMQVGAPPPVSLLCAVELRTDRNARFRRRMWRVSKRTR
jgi:hypothetical protein